MNAATAAKRATCFDGSREAVLREAVTGCYGSAIIRVATTTRKFNIDRNPTPAGLPLDLHNLYANALNFGQDPVALLLRFPLERVRAVHLSGGKWIPEPGAALGAKPRLRVLDDHVHDVPDGVFGLLSLLAQRAPPQRDVIIERAGEYPDFACLITQLDAAREALRRSRTAAVPRRDAA